MFPLSIITIMFVLVYCATFCYLLLLLFCSKNVSLRRVLPVFLGAMFCVMSLTILQDCVGRKRVLSEAFPTYHRGGSVYFKDGAKEINANKEFGQNVYPYLQIVLKYKYPSTFWIYDDDLVPDYRLE